VGTARTLIAALTLVCRANRSVFAGRLAVTVLTGLAPVAAAWLLRAILDLLATGHPRDPLLVSVALLAAASALQTVLPSVGQYLSAQADRSSQRRTTTELFAAVSRLAGLRRLEDPRFHDRLNLAQYSSGSAPGQIFTGSVAIVQAGLTLSGFLITLTVLNPVIAAIAVLAAIPGLYSELDISRRRVAMLTGLSHAQRRQFFYAGLLTDYAAAKEIRLFGLGGFFQQRLLDQLRAIHRGNERIDRRALAVYTGLALLGALIASGGLVWAVFAAARGQLSIGDVSIFVAALTSVSATLSTIISNAAMTHQSLLMFDAYTEVVHEGPDLALPPRPAPAASLRHGLELDNVWFRYAPDQPWVLRGVSFFIPRGQAVGVVGHNGAGKSTLVKLMCRFYDPDQGTIRWDGVDLRDLDLASLRDRISVVFQDFMAYELSAADNIAVGDLKQEASHEALARAAQQAGIHQTLTALPAGYDTLLTRTYFDLADRDDPRTGVLLSGGQWQRLGLARALLRSNRDLLILDEPSSGLDAEAEHEIHRSLRAERRRQATVLISHRLNTLRDADHILVLTDGVIGEQGTHDALMARSGIYARLFTLQAQGYATESAAD
jgi:ATP-binding cassette subfamily B protein